MKVVSEPEIINENIPSDGEEISVAQEDDLQGKSTDSNPDVTPQKEIQNKTPEEGVELSDQILPLDVESQSDPKISTLVVSMIVTDSECAEQNEKLLDKSLEEQATSTDDTNELKNDNQDRDNSMVEFEPPQNSTAVSEDIACEVEHPLQNIEMQTSDEMQIDSNAKQTQMAIFSEEEETIAEQPPEEPVELEKSNINQENRIEDEQMKDDPIARAISKKVDGSLLISNYLSENE